MEVAVVVVEVEVAVAARHLPEQLRRHVEEAGEVDRRALRRHHRRRRPREAGGAGDAAAAGHAARDAAGGAGDAGGGAAQAEARHLSAEALRHPHALERGPVGGSAAGERRRPRHAGHHERARQRRVLRDGPTHESRIDLHGLAEDGNLAVLQRRRRRRRADEATEGVECEALGGKPPEEREERGEKWGKRGEAPWVRGPLACPRRCLNFAPWRWNLIPPGASSPNRSSASATCDSVAFGGTRISMTVNGQTRRSAGAMPPKSFAPGLRCGG